MTLNRISAGVALFALVVVLGLHASPAQAQFVQQPNIGTANGMLPQQNAGFGQGTNLTPQQLQTMMMMRAMAGRRGGVRTGIPQAIPMGGGGFGGGFGDDPVSLPGADEDTSSNRKAAAQKKADARKAREEKNRLAKEEKAKKAAKGAKKPATKF